MQFEKGHIPWNKGGTVEKIRGKNHWNWKGEARAEALRVRRSAEYKVWHQAVLKRDDYTCQLCGVRGGRLEVDHIKSFAAYPELRLDIDNGRALCRPCHYKTPSYGFKGRVEPVITRSSRNTSGHVGVRYHKQFDLWYAAIVYKRKRYTKYYREKDRAIECRKEFERMIAEGLPIVAPPRDLQTHCKWGHEFNQANTWHNTRRGKRSDRQCRRCNALRGFSRRESSQRLRSSLM